MRHKRTTPALFHRAKELRRKMTPAEIKLWAYLRAHRANDAGFRRQHAIGPYIPDFCAPRRKLIIEVDGSQHLDQTEYDAERTTYLEHHGYRVLRFFNGDIMNDINGVMGVILEELGDESNKEN
ncbi:MAG: putative restriction endonuclease-like [Anaerolineaceae bacterium]|nr:MAG: putative restriction endonuclease-like [Anaerolineaceae bacterium]